MSILPALRAATAPDHARLEAVMALDDPALDRRRYGLALLVLHAARAGWEPELERVHPGTAAGPHLPWLRADLAALGLRPGAPEPPLGLSPAAAWGVRYVLEGSALGGRVIARQAERLGFGPEHGARYFSGRGAGTGAHWRDFLAALESAAAEQAAPGILRGAQAAFAALLRRAEAEFAPALPAQPAMT